MRLFTTSKYIGWSRWPTVNQVVNTHKVCEHNFGLTAGQTKLRTKTKSNCARYISKQQLIDISHLITEEYYYNVLVSRCTVVNWIPKKIRKPFFWSQKDEFGMSRFKKNVLMSSFAITLFIDTAIL